MLFQKIIIDGFIPFTHCGNKHVEVNFDEPCTTIIGANGSGKSSMLRELSVFPSTRTDYQKNGYTEITLEHDGHIYELASHFENATSPNSFKKDDVELNVGGTGDTQRDLIIEHFGYTPSIHELMSGNIHICSMTRAARKQLFSTSYPSDLSFVLDYHKKVCSNIRAFANQIKLLQSREGSLVAALIDPSEKKRLEDYRTSCLEITDRIDKVNLLLDNEIDRLRNDPVMHKPYHPEELDGLAYRFDQLRKEYIYELIDPNRSKLLGEKVDAINLNLLYTQLNSELGHLEKNKEYIQNNLQEIRDELDKFTNLKYASNDDKKSSITAELKVVDQEISLLDQDKSWQEIPLVAMDKLLDVVELEPEISNLIGQIHPYSGRILDQEQINKLNSEIYVAQNTLSSLKNEVTELDVQLQKANERLALLTKNSFPSDCTRGCNLRMTVESSIRDVRNRIKDIDLRKSEIESHKKNAEEIIATNQKRLTEFNPVRPMLKSLWDIITDNYLSEIAFGEDSFVECLNTNSYEIVNRINKSVEASKKYYRHKNLTDRKNELIRTLGMMESVESTQMSAEMIEKIIDDRERKINAGIQQIDDIERNCEQITRNVDLITDVASVIKKIEKLVEIAETNLNIKLIKTRIEFDQQMIREHTAIKNELNTRLREIERTLDDQKRVNDVLATEIRPVMEDLKNKKLKWEFVESGLDPAKGLPCVYLVRFINRLMSTANNLIKEVWCHDMELVYLNEEDDLDFTIQVMQNKSTIVKDISLCSKGEQAMIDLAMVLAIAIERGYLQKYPISLDEIDAGLTDSHRAKLTGLIDRLLSDGTVKQMFLVNHFAMQTGLSHSSCVCLCSDGIILPGGEVNKNAIIS